MSRNDTQRTGENHSSRINFGRNFFWAGWAPWFSCSHLTGGKHQTYEVFKILKSWHQGDFDGFARLFFSLFFRGVGMGADSLCLCL